VTSSAPTVSTKLARLAEQSKREPGRVFTTLAHLLDEDFLSEAFQQLRPGAAAGIDEVTVAGYRQRLKENLHALHQRLIQGQYRAQPARRVWIPKADGSQRPLAILVLEDKIVQRAVALLLEAIYEPHFRGFSHGFRPGRSAHGALSDLRQQCLKLGIHWIVDADVAKFFDTIDHTQLMTVLKQRINDGAILRLIGKWLHVGVLEEGKVISSDKGTPQGGVISPILANIFLHTVLDEWFEADVRPCMAGNCFLVRYADDFVMGFASKEDAEKVFRVLPKRFERYGLKIHPDKSRLVSFGRPPGPDGPGPGTFAFLGFTHYWDRTREGGWTIKRKTERKRLSRFLSGLREWCRKHRHDDITEQHGVLTSKLRGHYQYYGVRSNYKMLEVAYEYAEGCWKWWLGRRNSKDRMNWQKWMARWRAICPLPKPRIVHAF